MTPDTAPNRAERLHRLGLLLELLAECQSCPDGQRERVARARTLALRRREIHWRWLAL